MIKVSLGRIISSDKVTSCSCTGACTGGQRSTQWGGGSRTGAATRVVMIKASLGKIFSSDKVTTCSCTGACTEMQREYTGGDRGGHRGWFDKGSFRQND